MLIRIIIFLAINFAALGLGGFFTGKAVTADWYVNLNKAPWTPPGWVFGAAWTFTFFYFHNAILGLAIIISLTLLVAYFLFNYWSVLEFKSLLILPYFIWLIIATSLNAYVVLNN